MGSLASKRAESATFITQKLTQPGVHLCVIKTDGAFYNIFVFHSKPTYRSRMDRPRYYLKFHQDHTSQDHFCSMIDDFPV